MRNERWSTTQEALAGVLERKKTLTDIDRGAIRAMQMTGSPAQQVRADALADRFDRKAAKKAKQQEPDEFAGLLDG